MMKKLLSAFLLTIVSWFLFGFIYYELWLVVQGVLTDISQITLPNIDIWHFVLLCGVFSTLRSGNVNRTKKEESMEVSNAWGVMVTKVITQAIFTLILMMLALLFL